MSQQKKLLEVDDVAEQIGMSTDWVYRRAREGVIPRVKLLGGRIRFRQVDVDQFIEASCEDNQDL